MTPRAILTAVVLSAILTACPSSGGGSISGIKTLDVGNGGVHRPGLINYPSETFGLPPAGGPHNDLWQLCGVYDKPVANEHAIHSLEHGAVWITYRPDLPSSEVDKLKSYAQGKSYLILSPYPRTFNGEAPTPLPSAVVVSAWGVQKGYSGADEEISRFISRYASGPDSKAPEKGALCDGPNAVRTPDPRAE